MIKFLIISLILLSTSCRPQVHTGSCDTYKSEIENLNSRISQLENDISNLESNNQQHSSYNKSQLTTDGSLHNSSFVSFRVVLRPDNCLYLILKHESTYTFAFAMITKGVIPAVGDIVHNDNLEFEPTKYNIFINSPFGPTYISIIESNLTKDIAIRLISEKCSVKGDG